MRQFRLARRADEEITEIFAYGYEQFGETQAEAYANGMTHVFQLLADNPRIGRAADRIALGIRRHEYRSHVILYEEEPNGVLILAVVHGRNLRRLSL